MEPQNIKKHGHTIDESEANHPAVKDCIKQLSKNHWLLGPSLMLERDISSDTFSTFFISKEFNLEWLPLDPKGPIQLLTCFNGQSMWKIGEWAYFKSKAWTKKTGLESTAIKLVQKKAPTVPVPTILEHYVDKTACRSYILLSNIPGINLNEAWQTLSKNQKVDVVNQVAQHIHTLAKLGGKRLKSAEGKWVPSPRLDFQLGKENLEDTKQNKFAFYHADLGPQNIKIMVNQKKYRDLEASVIVTGLLDWKIGYFPRRWISKKPFVSTTICFDWDGVKGQEEWPMLLEKLLIERGYPVFDELNGWRCKEQDEGAAIFLE